MTSFFDGFTHFAPAHAKGAFVCFSLETCEKCGSTIYNDAAASANVHSVTLPGGDVLTGERLKNYLYGVHGMVFMHRLPPNMVVDFHDDEDQDEEWGCENCM